MLVAFAALLLQAGPRDRPDLRAGLDTLYAGDFPQAAAYFAGLAARDTTDAAPLVFEAGAYIWWAAAQDSDDYAAATIDSLLATAITRARAGGPAADFWAATALGYRARERDLRGHGPGAAIGAAKDAKAMRDLYQRILAADSTCADCYLGLGLYHYGLARASALARFVAKLMGMGSGDAADGVAEMRRAADGGDLARIEARWVLASALMREAARDKSGAADLRREARDEVAALAERYPRNPVFQHFLARLPAAAP